MKFKKIFRISLLFSMFSVLCWFISRPTIAPDKAFYFWLTRWSPSQSLLQAIDKNNITKLYVRFFDVVWIPERGAAEPVAPITFSAPLPPKVAIIPVVFLKNDLFKNASSIELDKLADRVWRKISTLLPEGSPPYKEIQVDCDWTVETRDKFFVFTAVLKQIAHQNGVRLSATIRLHQVKYPNITGVPPVDRGMLMFYNIGKIRAATGDSSIYSAKDALNYVSSVKSYKLPLDAVLPIFSWAIHSRDGRVIDLIEDIDREELTHIEWFQPDSDQSYFAREGGFFHGRYFSRGDQIKFEAMTPESTMEAAALLSRNQPKDGPFRTVAFFDLSERNLKIYADHDFKKIFARF